MFKYVIKYCIRTIVKSCLKINIIEKIIEENFSNGSKIHEFKYKSLNKNIQRDLNAIPSQTTEGERNFLYHFFKSIWTGNGNIIEIGPFLGGTTRAIAMGMLQNPRRNKDYKIYTFDRFSDYFNVKDLTQYLRPLIEKKQLTRDDINKLGSNTQFISIFKTIHEHQSYYECIEPSNHGVPDHVNDKNKGPWMQLPEHFYTEVVFIDGCKSWYGTKFFMQKISHTTKPGTYYIFQDFGWFTCFWLPAFIEIFCNYFSLIGHVDNTYVFQLKHILTFKTIEEKFLDSPDKYEVTDFIQLFDNQIDKAKQRHDHYAEIRHTLHKAGALAYINCLEEAKIILKQTENIKYASHHKDVIAMAWKSPTYTPQGPINLN